MKKTIVILLLAALLLALTACAAGPNPQAGLQRVESAPHPAGFLLGLWHGLIAPITFVISLFNHNVSVYEVYNSRGWYDFGFLLGLSIAFGGGGRASKRNRPKKQEEQK
jgi:hypothetical protein